MNAASPPTESAPAPRVPVLGEAALHAADDAATQAVGARLAGALVPGLVIALEGDLGTGKTTLVRALLRALGWTGPVKSPTYTLVEHYPLSSLYFYHFDFYRVENPDEWDSAGFAEYFSQGSVCVVEWPERVGDRLPAPDLVIVLAYASENPEAGRDLTLRAYSQAGLPCLSAILPRGA